MEELKQEFVKLNFDYEYELSKQQISSKKRAQINYEFQYLFFWSGDPRTLVVDKSESLDYQDFLKSQGKKYQTLLTSQIEKNCWQNIWGALKNRPIEKRFNSKIFAETLKRKLDPSIRTFYVLDGTEFELQIDFNQQYFLRPEFGFSGQQSRLVSGRDEFEKIKAFARQDQKFILTPFNKPLVNFSSFFTEKGTPLYFLNSVHKGVYKGCDFLGEDLREIFPEKSTREEFKALEESFVSEIYKQGGKAPFGVDSFIGECGPNFFHEVNYRNTFSYLVYQIFLKNSLYARGGVRILPTAKLKSLFKREREKRVENGRMLWISPEDRFFGVVITESSTREGLSEINSMLR